MLPLVMQLSATVHYINISEADHPRNLSDVLEATAGFHVKNMKTHAEINKAML
jgi:hypothetical protein